MRICEAEGEAKIVPATAAVRRPEPTKEEKEKHWYDIDDKRKKQLEVRL